MHKTNQPTIFFFPGGQLRHIETNKPFEFNVSDDTSYNQQHYEALGRGKIFVLFFLFFNFILQS